MRTSINQPPIGTRLNRSHPLSQGLVGEWLMNEGGGLKAQDSTRINGTDGVLTSGTVFAQTARGNAASITASGPSYITIPANSYINAFNSMSMSVWVNYINLQKPFNQVLMKNTSNSAFYGLIVGGTGGVVGDIELQFSGSATLSSAAGVITTGKWFHICCTRNTGAASNNETIYLNGVNIKVGTGATGNIDTTTAPLVFGRDPVNSNRDSTMYLQDVKLYNRCLLPSEVMQLYTNPYQIFIGKVR